MSLDCEYCGRSLPVEQTEIRNGKWVCVDQKACDEADEKRYQRHVADLRRRAREGDELTEAERGEVAR